MRLWFRLTSYKRVLTFETVSEIRKFYKKGLADLRPAACHKNGLLSFIRKFSPFSSVLWANSLLSRFISLRYL